MTDWADYFVETNEPPSSEEQALQFALVDFRTMKPETQKAFIVAALDEYCALAKDGKIEKHLAGQVLLRAQLVASWLDLPHPGKLKVVSNG